MCDYSIVAVRSRLAQKGDWLVTKDFGFGTVGFADEKDTDCAVCLAPGTELAFSLRVRKRYWLFRKHVSTNLVASFFQQNLHLENAHHDSLEFPCGIKVMLNDIAAHQHALVIQLPATQRASTLAELRHLHVVQ